MKTLRRSLALLLILCAAVLPLISGCHGARGLAAFEIPEAFDTTREYEITFLFFNYQTTPISNA